MVYIRRRIRRRLKMFTMRQRIKHGLATDRDRWIYLRTSYAKVRDPAFYGGEYDKLVADKRVKELQVTEKDGIHLVTGRVFKKVRVGNGQEHTLFLGAYDTHIQLRPYSLLTEFLVPNATTHFWVNCIESGRYDETLKATYPVNDAHNFCFGTRRVFLEQLANSGEFYTLCNLVLDSLWHVNETSIQTFVQYFRKVNQDGTIEPYRIPNATPVLNNEFNEYG